MGRKKIVQDEELLAAAKEVFIEKGFAASTREIARRAGVSETVIYQRHPTKEHLFFAAMVPPPMDVERLLIHREDGKVCEGLEEIALVLMDYFRNLMPILLALMTHSSFDFEAFVRRHPDSHLNRLREGLQTYLRRGGVAGRHVGPAALTLFATMHSLAIFERLGAHGGRFEAATIRAVIRTLWDGLAPSTDGAPRRKGEGAEPLRR